jgi:DNA-binding NarL/FixJ family response regulator
MSRTVTILIVEDEALIAMSLQVELKRAGYLVDRCVATSDAAIERVEQATPDVILMDIRLAGQTSGLEAAQQIRARHHTVPIIFMTGFEKDPYIESINALKPSGMLLKPVRISALKNMIDTLCTEG